MTGAPPAPGALSLLEQVQRLLERTYRMRSGIDDLGRFVVGDRGYRQIYGSAGEMVDSVVTARDEGSAARTLVRETAEGVRVSVYYPDGLIRHLERFPPQRGLGDENVDAFATLVEELDHLLMVAERAREARPVTLFELELHANVSKHLVLTRFVAGRRRRIDAARRRWLRHHLFDKVRFCDRDAGVRQRYRDATRWAVRLIDVLPRLAVIRRIDTLRSFHRAGARGKLELIDGLNGGPAAYSALARS
jgi:hypothetical protein